jgi:TRAP-type C4-dicarboxylate transport system substrate-binding protein
MESVFKRLEAESNGKLLIKPYWGGTLHGARDGFKAAAENITDYTHATSGHQPGSFQLIHGISLPFMFPDGPVGAMVYEELYPKYFKKEYENMNVYFGGVMMTSSLRFVSKKPIRKLEDLRGVKVGSPMGGVVADIFTSLGAVSVPMQPAEMYTSFQRGVFDVFAGHDSTFCTFRAYELANFKTIVDLAVAPLEFGLNRKTFDSLPKDLKIILYNWFRKHAQFTSQVHSLRDGERCNVKLKESGIEEIELSPEESQRWKDATGTIMDKFITENEAKGLPAKQLIADMRDLSKKYSTMTWNDLMRRTIEHPIQGIIDF